MMKQNTKRIRSILAGVVLGALIFFSTPSMVHAQLGTVEIVNNNAFGINIYTQAYDRYGRRFWRRIAGIPAKGKRLFPRVRNGILFGADNKQKNIYCKPRRVKYDRSFFHRIIFQRCRSRRR